MRASLVSNFEKWKDHAEYTDFSNLLRGDEKGKRFNNDIWWCMRFYNAWGRVLENMPESTMYVRYEDLKIDTYGVLKNNSDFLGLELSNEQLQHGIHGASKNKMQVKHDPTALTVVRNEKRNPIA